MRAHRRIVEGPAVRKPLRQAPAAIQGAILALDAVDPPRLGRGSHVPLAGIVHLIPATMHRRQKDSFRLQRVLVRHRLGFMGITAGEECGACRQADGRGRETAVERDALGSEPNPGAASGRASARDTRACPLAAGRHDEEHVRLRRLGLRAGRPGAARGSTRRAEQANRLRNSRRPSMLTKSSVS